MWTNTAEIEQLIKNYANDYPSIAERIPLADVVSADAGVAPKPVSALRIGAKGAHAVDGALLIFGQHAREWVPPEVALEIAGALLDSYTNGTPLTYGGKTYAATDIQRIVNNINIFLIPCVNPQGRQYSLDFDTRDDGWRKNRGKIPGSSQIGVDPNRNFDFAFDLAKHFDLNNPKVLAHTSTTPSIETYQGPKAFSEPETQNVRWVLDTYPRIRWFVDTHGYTWNGQIYYPWGDDENQSADPAMNWRNPAHDHKRGWPGDAVGEFIGAGDLATHRYLANRLKAGADPVNNRTYEVKQSYALYPTAGCSDDYVWSRHFLSPYLPRVEAFVIEHRASRFKPESPEREQVIEEVASGLINFCLACACGVPGLSVQLRTSNVVFNHCPEGRTSSRPVILQVTGCEAATFRVMSGPSRTSGSTRINFGVAVASQTVPGVTVPVTRELFIWLTCAGGLGGDTAGGTVRVECPEAGFVHDVPITADFVAAPRAGAVLVLDRSGSMTEDGGDGRTRLDVLLDSAPAFVEVAPQNARIGLVRFATDESPGAPMTTMGPEGDDPTGRGVIRKAITDHTVATGSAQYTSIGDGVFAATNLIAPESGVDFKSLVVLTDGHENRDRYLSDISGLINNRVFGIGLGTPEQIQPIALQAMTNGTNGYLLMTGAMDVNDPFRLAKYYLQILTGVTNDQVVLDPGGWLPFGGAETIPFYLNEADASVDAIVLTSFPQLLRIRLRAPSGQIFDQSHPSMTYAQREGIAYYRFAQPIPGPYSFEGPGRWELLLDWKKAPTRELLKRLQSSAVGWSEKSVRFDVLVHARSDLEMATTVSQNRFSPGATITARVRLTQYQSVPVDSAKVITRVTFPDGATPVLQLTPKGDGVFETQFTAPLAGLYRMRITAEGSTLRGLRFTREAVRTAFAWAGGDSKPPNRHDDGWCGTLRCLIDSKAVDPELLKRLGINLERLSECCQTEERLVIAKPAKAVRRAPAKTKK